MLCLMFFSTKPVEYFKKMKLRGYVGRTISDKHEPVVQQNNVIKFKQAP